MNDNASASLFLHFRDLEDPRVNRTKRHHLDDILLLSLAGMLVGCEHCTEIEDFGHAHVDWFQSLGYLQNGVPSHDTIGRVFQALDPRQFSACLHAWVASVTKHIPGVIAIDGKTSRSSAPAPDARPIHTVSAWSSLTGLSLAHEFIDEKSNEITAIPKVLDLLQMEGCLITIDAMGCQTDIAEKITDNKADYVLALKGNQGTLHQDVIDFFEDAHAHGWHDIDHSSTSELATGHGRSERRDLWAAPVSAPWKEAAQWPGLEQVIWVRSERSVQGKTTVEHRYYITSATDEAPRLAQAIRSHWGIENSLHWVLDVVFKEDRDTARKKNAAKNYTTARRLAYNILKQDDKKMGMKRKQRLAAYDKDYLLKLLTIAGGGVSP